MPTSSDIPCGLDFCGSSVLIGRLCHKFARASLGIFRAGSSSAYARRCGAVIAPLQAEPEGDERSSFRVCAARGLTSEPLLLCVRVDVSVMRGLVRLPSIESCIDDAAHELAVDLLAAGALGRDLGAPGAIVSPLGERGVGDGWQLLGLCARRLPVRRRRLRRCSCGAALSRTRDRSRTTSSIGRRRRAHRPARRSCG